MAAAAALITVDRAGYLLQLRDLRQDIWYPGQWGLFGGQNFGHETPEASIRRELAEELCLTSCELNYFLDSAFGFSFASRQLTRTVFEVDISGSQAAALQ
jgi:ADP-ribose pyrophosphatase YjhB (NUDIX family)